MSAAIIGMHEWFDTPPGRYLLAWEQAEFDQAVGDIFGYHALQLGLPELDALRANRMPHKWLGLRELQPWPGAPRPALLADPAALPFEAGSLDLVVLPHALELGADPHATLREVERVLMPEGKVVISCLNPASLWGLRRHRTRLQHRMGWGQPFLPQAGELIGYRRLRDWLRLLNFEVETGNFGCWRPAFSTEQWLARVDWMDRAGDRWWPILGAVYFIVATKRVPGPKLVGRRWKPAKAIATAPVPVANRAQRHASPPRATATPAAAPTQEMS